MIEQYEDQLIEFIKIEMQQDLAHDIRHVCRVVNMAKSLCLSEGANMDVVVPAAYLHDCFSFAKNHPDRAQSSRFAADKAIAFLRNIDYPKTLLPAIHHAIVAHSYSANIKPQSLEAQIVQDADRLDALGAIGIARCLQVSTSLGVSLYHVDDPFCINRQANDRLFAIDHFFTKLFKLADTMHTESAKIEASKRIKYMKSFLAQLSTEI
ncbi:HD domain-containing protein [Shewanella inventionis]|uniref:Phosphohydrolase n=1 Tax=Shewanella inventionis TaxID=1738770 RepID=A0ABQ1IPZ1_9GAMM|nr:HD domain-containing protein [Shewanella inventionis]MCL1158937.1 HD domain-containing protein [Shewanella inventionis]UAL41881.1 HD domain-containing protein [Shewanella inventionis]GGB48632.1 phosphohydrolase [Shewanella inventionis]